MHPIDEAVALIAQDQWGTFSDRQAKGVGASSTFRARRVASGTWIRFAEGSLGLSGWPPSYERSLWAALHAGCPEAGLGGWSGSAIYGIRGFPRTRLDLLVPHGRLHTNPLAIVTQTRRMPVLVRFNGFPIPSRERVLCEVARHVDPKRLGAALDDQLIKRTILLPRLERVFLSLAAPAWPGLRVMGAVIAERGDGYVPTRSELERELRLIVATVPDIEPEFEKQIGDPMEMPHQVDVVIEEPRKLILEADGRSYHQRLQDMTLDRRRDRRAGMLGYTTFRYLYGEIVGDRGAIRAEIIRFLFG